MTTDKSRVTAPASAALRLALVIALQAACIAPSRSEGPAAPALKEEIAKQEIIYRSRGSEVPRGYVTGRSLNGYVQILPPGFDRALENLGPSDRWLDIGAGMGQAILDYYTPEYDLQHFGGARPDSKARAVALSIEDRRTELWRKKAASLGDGQIRYLFSKPLRDYSGEELGKFQMITDVYGGLSYTDNLSLFMEKVLDLLEINGRFFSLLQDVQLEDGKDKLYDPAPYYLTELQDAGGKDVKVCSWFKRITCVKVTCESRSTWDSPTELIDLQKVCGEVSVPALQPLSYEAGTPPGRRFRLK